MSRKFSIINSLTVGKQSYVLIEKKKAQVVILSKLNSQLKILHRFLIEFL